MQPIPIRGRGATENPPNRFERLAYVPDPDSRDPEDDGPATLYFRDSTRTILTRNDSPDVGFTYSVNPYRGCSHGCSYCLDGDTPILMGDSSVRALAELAVGDEIYGTERRGRYRRYVRTRVLAHWWTLKAAYRVTLEDGTELVASGDHRFLTERGWKFVMDSGVAGRQRPRLTVNNKLIGVGAFTTPFSDTVDYRHGYLCGMIRGDALLARYDYQRPGRSHGNQYHFRLALIDEPALVRSAEYLRDIGIATHRRAFSPGDSNRRPMQAIHANALAAVERIERLVDWPIHPVPDWCRGFLAGIFDAEGSHSGGIMRITNTDPEIVAQTVDCLMRFGFDFRVETRTPKSGKIQSVVRIRGGLREHLRFFHLVRPAIRRKCDIEGQAVKSDAALRVVSIEPVGTRPLFDVTTGTGDFIANGVVSHNCYARPTHEWLGLSAGLDFESKIFVKEEAPELLREALTKRSWAPAPVALSGVTDCYQPIERKLGITRKCVEVLAEFRNPIAMITKNHLITRDADLLAGMAEWGGAMAHLSITTLDAELQRVMEPRASTPARRLEAVETLARAGIPVGVMVAPVIPGLTDHELPAILRAVADAGGRSAGFVPLRLPHGLGELFESWLETHYPERKEKVLHRIREMRGGRLNDPDFGSRMRGQGEYAEQIRALFHVTCRKLGLNRDPIELSTASFRRPDPTGQLGLFE